MFDACKRSFGGKRVALFGSYGWGDGEWMRTWESDCDSAGVNLVCESVICTETPDDAALEACRALARHWRSEKCPPPLTVALATDRCDLHLLNSQPEKAGTPLAVFLPCAVWRVLKRICSSIQDG